jgi:hypothetical protein
MEELELPALVTACATDAHYRVADALALKFDSEFSASNDGFEISCWEFC